MLLVSAVRRKFTVDEFYRMAKAGIFHEDDRVELIEGEIVAMAPIGSRSSAEPAGRPRKAAQCSRE